MHSLREFTRQYPDHGMPYFGANEMIQWGDDVQTQMGQLFNAITLTSREVNTCREELNHLRTVYSWLMTNHPEVIEAYKTVKAVEERLA